MTQVVTLTPLPRADADWLHDVASAYFHELIPKGPSLPRGETEEWFEEPETHPLLISVSNARVGFALVDCINSHSEMCEFCVFPEQRNAGIGAQAAALCFERFPGPWTLGVASALPGTARFWDRLLPTLPGIEGLVRKSPYTPYQCHSYSFTARGKT